MTVKTWPVKLGASDGMPSSLFDPRWQQPDVASRVALVLFCRGAGQDAGAPPTATLAAPPAPARPELVDARTFVFSQVLPISDGVATRFKGGSYGELHRHYAFGKYSVNFHAQAVAFGFDDAGRWFLSGTVGRFDGPWGNDATLVVSYFAGPEFLGAATWQRALDPVGDVSVRMRGRDLRLASRFDAVTRAEVQFIARHGRDVPAEAAPRGPARPSRARLAVQALAKQRGDDEEPT